jgi:DNA gyrase subunit A
MPAPIAHEIREISAADELGGSFLPYSLSVITARALPDVRDGLKPVQRRILVTMRDLGLRPNTPHRKSARVVGDCMGRYHPHGDSAIYDALVRMGQDFTMRLGLVDPHGNFGFLDDPPAAARYTECRQSEAAAQMLAELDEETVEWRSTYDGEGDEPVYLPARMPNLLVNGASGIAVGMATNMAPHNLAEVVEALKLVLRRPQRPPSVDELMARVPGPDFPTGGIVVDDGGLREAYTTGRGSFRMRAVAEIGQVSARRTGIVITELPYMVTPERVLNRVKELVNSGRLTAITDVNNYSDRKGGLRLQFELRSGTNGEAVLAELYRLTPLEENFAINNVALVDGVPTTLGLGDLCRHFVNHRIDVVVRRTRFRLRRATERAHLVEGLLIALDHIEQVIAIIRASADVATARAALMEALALSEVQANAILDMRLRRLTALEKQELVDELAELRDEIAGYERILDSSDVQRKVVADELDELVKALGNPRRTRIVGGDEMPRLTAADAPADFDLGDDPCVITLATSGAIGREPAGSHHTGKLGRHDVIRAEVHTSNRQTVWAISDRGRVLALAAHDVPEVAGRSRGASAGELYTLGHGERVIGLTGAGVDPLLIVTANGVAKRVAADEVALTKDGAAVIGLDDGDRVVAAFPVAEETEVAMVASDAQVLRIAVATVPVQGRAARGVAGMKLRGGAKVVTAGIAEVDGVVLTVSEAGGAKLTAAAEVPRQGRAAGGVRLTRLRPEDGRVRYALVAANADLAAIIGTVEDPDKSDPAPVPLPVQSTRRDGASMRTPQPIHAAGKARW